MDQSQTMTATAYLKPDMAAVEATPELAAAGGQVALPPLEAPTWTVVQQTITTNGETVEIHETTLAAGLALAEAAQVLTGHTAQAQALIASAEPLRQLPDGSYALNSVAPLRINAHDLAQLRPLDHGDEE